MHSTQRQCFEKDLSSDCTALLKLLRSVCLQSVPFFNQHGGVKQCPRQQQPHKTHKRDSKRKQDYVAEQRCQLLRSLHKCIYASQRNVRDWCSRAGSCPTWSVAHTHHVACPQDNSMCAQHAQSCRDGTVFPAGSVQP